MPALFAEAIDHEQRVVDPDRQPDHRNDVGDEEGKLSGLADERR